MVRLVLRSTATEARVRKHLPWLRERLPALRVLTLNIQPEHRAVLEGEREVVLTEEETLPMRLGGPGGPGGPAGPGGIVLHLRPRRLLPDQHRRGRRGSTRWRPSGPRTSLRAAWSTSTAGSAASRCTWPRPAAPSPGSRSAPTRSPVPSAPATRRACPVRSRSPRAMRPHPSTRRS
ncbi:hypothetical protein [Nocardioides convexus]|uniref:hypothetical protein n=1 Tax=Nocardioides convexus TaxID=2712224 RepID=UPI00241842C8|nr:hypothetical protein [Nocardioides convexus]